MLFRYRDLGQLRECPPPVGTEVLLAPSLVGSDRSHVAFLPFPRVPFRYTKSGRYLLLENQVRLIDQSDNGDSHSTRTSSLVLTITIIRTEFGHFHLLCRINKFKK